MNHQNDGAIIKALSQPHGSQCYNLCLARRVTFHMTMSLFQIAINGAFSKSITFKWIDFGVESVSFARDLSVDFL
jgi:hypothetical protein